MIFCLIDLGDKDVVEEIKGLIGNSTPDIVVIDATTRKSASVL